MYISFEPHNNSLTVPKPARDLRMWGLSIKMATVPSPLQSKLKNEYTAGGRNAITVTKFKNKIHWLYVYTSALALA